MGAKKDTGLPFGVAIDRVTHFLAGLVLIRGTDTC